jgi:hypothetical protein
MNKIGWQVIERIAVLVAICFLCWLLASAWPLTLLAIYILLLAQA